MKNFILPCFVTVLLSIACDSNKARNSAPQDEAKSSTEIITDSSDDVQKTLEQMKELTPLNPDQVKGLFPDELSGIKQSDYRRINNEGYEIGEATYKSDDGKELHLTIFDCVGDAGVGKYNIMYLGYINTESGDETGYKKPVSFNGEKAIESYEKNQDKYGILFPSGKRFLVSVEGEKTGLDTVKQAASSLNLKTN